MAKEKKSTKEEIVEHMNFHKEIVEYEQKELVEKIAKYEREHE